MDDLLERAEEVDDLLERAEDWAARDPDPHTRWLMESWIARGDTAALKEAFANPLTFGTAGLRGTVGAGPAKMNALQVHRTSWALADYLATLPLSGRPVVLGYDARPESKGFAAIAATTLLHSGRVVFLALEAVPTPLIAFAVRHLQAAAGVVVTASHNPRGDNGFKLYDDLGIQIVAPWDEEIARRMERASVFSADFEEWSDAARVLKHPGCHPLGESIARQYMAGCLATAECVGKRDPGTGSVVSPKIAYTPLHGVGARWAQRVADGHDIELVVVDEQAYPDGEFPTAAFPNPEEPGVMDRVASLAESRGAELAVANDPDADRIAVCLPDEWGRFERLSGDALGVLFADGVLEARAGSPATCISTVVSSPMLDRIAHSRGAKVVRTLTGFKWICRAAQGLPDFAFGYEEALGYCFAPPSGHLAVLDKDGLAALSALVGLLRQTGGGVGLRQRLIGLYVQHGLFVTHGHSMRFSGADAGERMKSAMERLRESPPEKLCGKPVSRLTDYATGWEQRPPYLGRQDLLEFELGAGGRIMVRPSGTEPKVKFYVHVSAPLTDAESYSRVRWELENEAKGLAVALETLALAPHESSS